MTVQWLLFIILCIVAALWIAYAALRAFNGIVYEIGILRRYLDARA